MNRNSILKINIKR